MPQKPPDRYFAASGANLRYRDDGHGAPIVFVHGWTLDLDMWEPQAAGLVPPYRIIRWDRRGFGLSSGAPAIAHDVADIRALCRHLGIQRAAFVGMSQGARVIRALASTAPSVISSLIFDGAPDLTSVPGLTANDVPLDRFRSLVRGGDGERFRSEWLSHPMSRLNSTDRAANATLQAMVARYPANDLHQTQRGDVDDPPLASGIPTLIINGALDLQTRKDAGIALKQALRGSEHIFIPGAGHLANLDNPEEYNATVRNFLERHPA